MHVFQMKKYVEKMQVVKKKMKKQYAKIQTQQI